MGEKAYKSMLTKGPEVAIAKRPILGRFARKCRRRTGGADGGPEDAWQQSKEGAAFADMAGGSSDGEEFPANIGPLVHKGSGDRSVGEATAAASSASAPAAEPEYNIPNNILGTPVRFVKANDSEGYSYLSRLAVKCPRHKSCTKSRSTQKHTDIWGPKAAELFLGAWLNAAGDMDERSHRAFTPTVGHREVSRS